MRKFLWKLLTGMNCSAEEMIELIVEADLTQAKKIDSLEAQNSLLTRRVWELELAAQKNEINWDTIKV